MNDIMGVQPLSAPVDETFTFRCSDGGEENPKEGDKRHDFVLGWQVFYGNEWVDGPVYQKLKIAGL